MRSLAAAGLREALPRVHEGVGRAGRERIVSVRLDQETWLRLQAARGPGESASGCVRRLLRLGLEVGAALERIEGLLRGPVRDPGAPAGGEDAGASRDGESDLRRRLLASLAAFGAGSPTDP